MCLDDFVSQELFIQGENGKCKYEVSFLLTFPKMNTCEGWVGNLLLEAVNPKKLESPSELWIEDRNFKNNNTTTTKPYTNKKQKQNKNSEDSAPGKEQNYNQYITSSWLPVLYWS